jgi:two-component system cell cycle sensor histidine kinase/response regulator CckA
LMLERLGYRVTVFQNPEEALARFWSSPDAFDALITDFQMPRLTGVELAKKIHSSRPSLPVFVVSGFTGDLTSKKARGEGITGFINKPIELPELAKALANALALGTRPGLPDA